MEGAYITLYVEFQENLTHNDGIITFYFCAIFDQKHCSFTIQHTINSRLSHQYDNFRNFQEQRISDKLTLSIRI